MKKIILLFLFSFLFLSFSLSSQAAPCYGTKLPEKNQFFAGAQTHVIFKRYLEDSYGELRSAQHFLQVSWGLFDWLSIDLKGGAGNLKQNPSDMDELDYTSSFAGGYGFRIKLYDNNKIKVVFGFQHISVHPKVIYIDNVKHKTVLDDWQASFLASYDFSRFTPYLGVKLSRTDYIHWVGDDRERRMSDLTKPLGVVFGLDLPLSKNTWLNLEGQLVDSQAIAISTNFAF